MKFDPPPVNHATAPISSPYSEHPFRLLNSREAAGWLKMHVRSLRRLARAGRIPVTRVGGRWMFNPSEILKSGRNPRA